MDEFAAEIMAFKGDDEYIPRTSLLAEVTDVVNGMVEVGFNAPLPGNPRIYLTLPLAELVRRSMKGDDK